MLSVNCPIKPTGTCTLDFSVDEYALVAALSLDEAKRLVNALLEYHGTKAFADAAEDVIEEFHQPNES